MVWLGIAFLLVAMVLAFFKLGSQFLDILKLDFSGVGENVLWLIFSLILAGIGAVILIIGFIQLLF